MSAVAQSFVGTWKVDNDASENFEAYLKAVGIPDDIIGKAVKAEVEVEWSVNGEELTHQIRTKTKEHHVTFTLGTEFTETPIGGQVLQTTYKDAGGKIVRTQLGGAHPCTTTMDMVGDQLIETMVCETSPPVSCIRRMNRV